MKIILLFSIILFFLTPKVLAIKEGKSSVNTSVTTNVNSSNNSSDSESQTHTYIEIEVNGEKKVLDTSEPGTHTLSIEKDGGKSSATVKIDNNINSSNQENEDGDPGSSINGDGEVKGTSEAIKETEGEQKNLIQKIFEEIKDFFERLFDL